MSTRGLLLVVSLLGLGALVWLLARPGSELARGFATPTSAPTEEIERGRDVDRLDDRATAGVLEAETSRSALALDAPLAEEGAAPDAEGEDDPGGDLLLRGRVVTRDADGREVPPIDGELRLVAWRGNAGQRHDAAVVAGEWSLRVPGRATLDYLTLSFVREQGAPLAIDSPRERIAVPADGVLEIHARRPRVARLVVVDARDGAELDDLELVLARGFEGPHPGPELRGRQRVDGLRSPIAPRAALRLHQDAKQARVLVGARGYAWARVEVDLERGGERLVALEPGGGLAVRLLGLGETPSGELRLRAGTETQPFFAAPAEREELLVEGLPPGPLRASVELGEWYAEQVVVLGAAGVTIAAGEVAHVTLLLDPAPEGRPPAPVRGLVLVPASWKADVRHVSAEPLVLEVPGPRETRRTGATRVESAREGMDAFAWSFEELPVGSHEVSIFRPSFSAILSVPPEGLDGVVLEAPPPAELQIRLLDEHGRDVVTDGLRWSPRAPEGAHGSSSHPAHRDADTGLYHVLAPAVLVDLHLHGWDHQSVQEAVDLTAGSRQHTIRLSKAHVLSVVLRDGDTPVAFPGGHFLPTPAVDGAGHVTRMSADNFDRRFNLTAPGTWHVDLPAIPGYRPPPRQTIDVEPAATTVHVIQLEREQR